MLPPRRKQATVPMEASISNKRLKIEKLHNTSLTNSLGIVKTEISILDYLELREVPYHFNMGLNSQKLTKTNFIPLKKKKKSIYFAALAVNCGPRTLFLAVACKLFRCGMWDLISQHGKSSQSPLQWGTEF